MEDSVLVMIRALRVKVDLSPVKVEVASAVAAVRVDLSPAKVASVQILVVVAIHAVVALHRVKVASDLETVAVAPLETVASVRVTIRALRVKAAALDVALAAAAPRVKVALDPVRIRVQPVMIRVARAAQVVLVANAATTAFLNAAKIKKKFYKSHLETRGGTFY